MKIARIISTIILPFILAETAFAGIAPISSTVVINTFTVNGPILNNDDYYAYGAAGIGDLDGDGVTDIAAGNWGSDVGGSNRGAVQISFLNADGSIKSTIPIDDTTVNGPVLNNGDAYGISVAPLGDLDGDGVMDIIVGTWAADAGGFNRGGVFIHFLNSDGSVKSTKEINSLTPNGPVLVNSDIYGVDVASMGDFDGDGVTDILVGAFQDDSGGSNRGAVYISRLNTDGSVKSTTKISSLTANGPVLANGYGYGRGVTSLGDLDGDGITDIAVGAETDNTGGPLRGAVHISFLNANGSVKSTKKISTLTPNGPTLADGDRYGVKTMNLGDLDGDGIVDLGVGAYIDDSGGTDRGAFYIHRLNTDGSVKATIKISNLTTNGPVLNNVDYYGTSIINMGDMNGDGNPEIAVGAGGNDTGGSNRGALFIHYFGSFVLPPVPTVLTPPASSTVYNDQTPTFTGTGSLAGNIITIKDGATLIGTGTIAADLTWTITSVVTLPYASYNFSVYESSIFNGPSLTHPVTLASDIIAPTNPVLAPDLQTASDTGSSNSDNLTSQNLPTLDVQCTEIGSTINLYTDNPAPNTPVGTHTCTAIAIESATVSTPLIDGLHNITYSEEDPAGNESAQSPSLAITIDTVPPAAVSIIAVGGDTSAPYATTNNPPTILITSAIGDTVTIPGFTCSPTPATSTTVTCTTSSAYTVNISQTVTIGVTDAAGNGPTTASLSFVVENVPTYGGSGAIFPDFIAPSQTIEQLTTTPTTNEENFATLSCLTQSVSDQSFTDIEDNFAKEAILLITNTFSNDTPIAEGYLDEKDNRTFSPNQDISRAEFLKMAMLSNCATINLLTATTSPTQTFPDVPSNSDLWYKNYVYSALEAGIVSGYQDGNFYPEKPITRAEATKILINLQHLIDENYQSQTYFTDVSKNDWFYNFISAGKENNLIFGSTDPEGNILFKPYDNISRAETALILVRIFNLREFIKISGPNG